MSVASGVRPFRGVGGLWNSTISTQSTRQAFRKDPQGWYSKFWLPHFVHSLEEPPKPNRGHTALQDLLEMCPSLSIITQNIDGLHTMNDTSTSTNDSNRIVEAHGRLGLFKCIPESDSDTDDESDDEDERLVHLGHRRKSRNLRDAYYASQCHNENGGNDGSTPSSSSKTRIPCRYELVDSISIEEVKPPSVQPALLGKAPLVQIPRCPACNRPCPPQTLQFDEGYHSHDYYQFERIENLLSGAEILVFVGTSFQGGVRITQVALEHARSTSLRVYNFNIFDKIKHSSEFSGIQNVMGPAQETLPKLVEACRAISEELKERQAQKRNTVVYGTEVVIYKSGNKRRRGKRERDVHTTLW